MSPEKQFLTEAASADLSDLDPLMSIWTMLDERVAAKPHDALFERKSGLGGTWQAVSATAFRDEVIAVAKGFVARGLQPGDRIGIMSRTRYEWTVVDFAAWAAGLVPVPIYETSSATQVKWIIDDAGLKLVVAETAAHGAVVKQAAKAHPDLDVLVIDKDAVGQLTADGADLADSAVTARGEKLVSADLATIIYTSGTTGSPKGVELTHGNFVYLTHNGKHPEGLGPVCAMPHSRTLLFMPLAHVFARFIQVLVVPSGAVLGHTPDIKNLLPDLAAFKPTFILAVPRVFEKVYNSAEQKAGSGVKLKIFRWAAKVAVTHSRTVDTGKRKPLVSLQHKVAGLLVYKKLQQTLGGAAEYAVSGGAPLGERLGHFYRGIGLRVLEGYGLTETTAPTAVNRPHLTKIGTVGPPFPGTQIRIKDGEILIKGNHVFRGYWNNPEATAEALVDGWFHTGDLGSLDDDGYLTITGRRKEIIITAGGKNVSPAVLEDRLRGHPLVSQVVVVGDRRPFIAALVTLDAEMLAGWLTSHGLPQMDVTTAAQHPKVLEALDRAAARASKAVSRAESIRKIHVLTTDFTEANGYLTPSLKVKRARVLQDFEQTIDNIYGGPADQK